jgi:hypothetical protein
MSLLSTDIVSAYACVLREGQPGRNLQELIPEQAAGNVPGTGMVVQIHTACKRLAKKGDTCFFGLYPYRSMIRDNAVY